MSRREDVVRQMLFNESKSYFSKTATRAGSARLWRELFPEDGEPVVWGEPREKPVRRERHFKKATIEKTGALSNLGKLGVGALTLGGLGAAGYGAYKGDQLSGQDRELARITEQASPDTFTHNYPRMAGALTAGYLPDEAQSTPDPRMHDIGIAIAQKHMAEGMAAQRGYTPDQIEYAPSKWQTIRENIQRDQAAQQARAMEEARTRAMAPQGVPDTAGMQGRQGV